MTTPRNKSNNGKFKTTAKLINYKGTWNTDEVVETFGYNSVGDGGGAKWRYTGNSIAASQSPADLADAKLSDANGNEFVCLNPTAHALGAKGDDATDDTLPLQALLNHKGTGNINNHKTIYLEDGYYRAQGLVQPDFVSIIGQSRKGTILKLINNATDHLLYSNRWTTDNIYATGYEHLENLTLDGNNANQTGVWHNVIVYGYGVKHNNIISKFASGDNIHLTDVTRNATNSATNMSEYHLTGSRVEKGAQYGINAVNNANKIADMHIEGNVFNGNGTSGEFGSIKIDRFAGGKILNNQSYGAGGDDIVVNNADRSVIAGNHVDVDGLNKTSGTLYGIKVTNGGDKSVNIENNAIYLDNNTGGATTLAAIGLNGVAASPIGGFTVVGNTITRDGAGSGTYYGIDNFNGSGKTLDVVSTGNNHIGLTSYTNGLITITAGS